MCRPAVFMMSWWNKNLNIEKNIFEDVHVGVSLVSFVEADQKPLQWPRHINVKILDNYVKLQPYAVAPAGYVATGFGLSDFSNGSSYPNTLPLDQFPRLSNIEIKGNRVIGRSYPHRNPTYGRLYPGAITIRSTSFLSGIVVNNNYFDIEANPAYSLPGQTNSTAMYLYPGTYYLQGDTQRHDVSFENNWDALGNPSVGSTISFPVVTASPAVADIVESLPILTDTAWRLLAVGKQPATAPQAPTDRFTGAQPTATPPPPPPVQSFPGVPAAPHNSTDPGKASPSCPPPTLKATPGICGCDALDLDSNNNGIIDCLTKAEFIAETTRLNRHVAGSFSSTTGVAKLHKVRALRTVRYLLRFSALHRAQLAGSYSVLASRLQKLRRLLVSSNVNSRNSGTLSATANNITRRLLRVSRLLPSVVTNESPWMTTQRNR